MPSEVQDRGAHELRAGLPRPLSQMPRLWMLLCVGTLCGFVVANGLALWSLPANEVARAWAVLTRDITASERALAEGQAAVDALQARLAQELGRTVLRVDEAARAPTVARWGRAPYDAQLVARASACLSDVSDPREVRCQQEDGWLTGSEASVILSTTRPRAISLDQAAALEAELAACEAAREVAWEALSTTRQALDDARVLLDQSRAKRSARTTAILFQWGLAMLATIGVGLGLFFAWLLRSPLPLVVRREQLVLDDRVIPATEIAGCQLHDGLLTVELLGGERIELLGLHVEGPTNLAGLRDSIRGLVRSPEDREAEAAAEVEAQRHAGRLRAHLQAGTEP